MKAFVAIVCVLMVIGISYCAWRSGALDSLLLRERETRHREPAYVPDKWERLLDRQYARRESTAEWAERVYGDLYRDSGVPEVDEAVRAHRALRAVPEEAWPHEWLRRQDTARRLLNRRTPYVQPEGPDEQLVGASERTRPGWAGPRGWREGDEPTAPVPAGEALKRFLFGVQEEDSRL